MTKIQNGLFIIIVIYFIGHAGSNTVKIGYTSTTAKERFAQIAPCSPVQLELIATADGSHRLEQALHEEFAEYRLHNEWFRIEGRLRDLLRRLVVHGPEALAEWLGPRDADHGTIAGYVNAGCRCDRCRIAWSAYQVRRRKADPALAAPLPCDHDLTRVSWRPGRRGRPPKCAVCREKLATATR